MNVFLAQLVDIFFRYLQMKQKEEKKRKKRNKKEQWVLFLFPFIAQKIFVVQKLTISF